MVIAENIIPLLHDKSSFFEVPVDTFLAQTWTSSNQTRNNIKISDPCCSLLQPTAVFF